MQKRLELIIGGQYEKEAFCYNCLQRDLQTKSQPIPQTIFLMVNDLGEMGGKNIFYCSLCAKAFLRSLEKYLEFNTEEYARVHETPQQKWIREKKERERN